MTDEEMRAIILDRSQLRRVLVGQTDRLAEALESEDFTRDLVAIGYRRTQLKKFNKLLSDAAFFQDEIKRHGAGGEKVWQSFFEDNKWIFGYGLAYHFLSSLTRKNLSRLSLAHRCRASENDLMLS